MSVKKKVNGKWYYEFMQKGERKHGLCHGCFNKPDAEEYERDVRQKLSLIARGKLPPEKPKIKFAKLVQMYLDYSKTNKKSYKTDVCNVKKLIAFFGAETFIDKILPKDIERFKAEYSNKLKKSTINRHRDALSKMFSIALANGLIDANPVRTIKKMKEDNYQIRFLTKQEEVELFKYLPEYMVPIVTCALHTGMRKTEILTLKWSNISFDTSYIVLLETKSGKKREIPISKKLLKVFKELKHAQKTSQEYVFLNPVTNAPYVDIRDGFEKALKQAKIKHFRFHDLRHTVATRLVEKGTDLVVVKDILGHANIQTTMRYAHPVPELKLKAVQVLNDY